MKKSTSAEELGQELSEDEIGKARTRAASPLFAS